jgi:hypothetical protein
MHSEGLTAEFPEQDVWRKKNKFPHQREVTLATQTVQKKGSRLNTKKIRHVPTVSVFALLTTFSCAAFGSSVHKCLGADGQYEFTDKKCPSTTPPTITEKSESAVVPPNSGVKHSDTAPTTLPSQEAAPTHPHHETQPKQSVTPANGATSSATLNSLSQE